MEGATTGSTTGVEARGRLAALWGGTVAGILGGLAVIGFTAIADYARGRDLWAGLKLAAYPFLRDRAMAPGFEVGALLQGITAHLGVSVIWGVLFGLFAYGMSRSATVSFGVIWGILVWIGMFYFVLPLASSSMLTRGMPAAIAVGQHLVFGLFTGLGFLPYQRTIPRRPVWARRLPVGAAP